MVRGQRRLLLTFAETRSISVSRQGMRATVSNIQQNEQGTAPRPTRLTTIVWAVVAAAIVLLVIAASSQTVRVWTNPQGSVDEVTINTPGDEVPASERPSSDDDQPAPWIGTTLHILALVLFFALAIMGVFTLGEVRRWRSIPRARAHGRMAGLVDGQPIGSEQQLHVDADAASEVLTQGAPRNAIVACWMQLERDATDSGWPRIATETSSEYVERVIAAASIDRVPIEELAALYREARFSRHDITDAHRSSAAMALARVVAVLDHHSGVPG